jgi:cytochrome c55X
VVTCPESRISSLLPGAALLLALAGACVAQPVPVLAEPTAARQHTLVRMVRQDCGSCHGMRLTGGLGPPLQPAALADKPVEALAATIYHGRPGTPMPGWRSLLSEADALWIAQRLVQGFPEEPIKANP